MKVDIVLIGNARAVRIPKALLDQCGFERTADIVADDGRLILRPATVVRRGWEDAFRRMAERRDDGLLETPALASDDADWTW